MRKFLNLIIGIIVSQYVVAQNPFSTDWKVLKTPQFKIIYPEWLAYDAYRIAESSQQVFYCDTATLNSKPRRVPLLMSTSTVTSNGYASLFPYRMEWYSKPMDDCSLGSTEWFQSLAIHEYRHIIQYKTINHGFTKLASCIFGAPGQGGMAYSIPTWFYEGDAVYAETVLSSQGRGRAANFEKLIAATLCSGKKMYSYDKSLLRSYRDYLPNQYPLGYMLVTSARNKYGADIFTNTIRRSSWYSFWPFAFGTAFNHFTDRHLGQHYRETYSDLKNFYTDRINSIHAVDYQKVNKTKKRYYTNYLCPRFINDTLLICIKNSLTKASQFVTLDFNGNEKKLDYTDASSFDTDGKIIVYASEVPDIRWTMRNYSDIAVYDISTGKRYLVTNKQKYFSPAISRDGNTLAVVEFTEDRRCNIVILKLQRYSDNRFTAIKMATFNGRRNEFFRSLTSVGNSGFAFVSNYQNKNSVCMVETANLQKVKTLIQPVSDNIFQLTNRGNEILYVSDQSGIDNIFSVDINSLEIKQLTNSKFGTSYPSVSPDGKILTFGDFSSLGNDVAIIKDIQPIEIQQSKRTNLFASMLEYEPAGSLDFIASKIPDTTKLKSKRYSNFSDPVRIYGWSPNAGTGYVSATVSSLNTLQTLSIQGTETYYSEKEIFRTDLNVLYSGFYPKISFTASLGEQSDTYLVKNGFFVSPQKIKWNENIYHAQIYVPFNFSRYNFSQNLTISAGFLRYSLSEKLKGVQSYQDLPNGNFPALSGSVSYSWSRKSAYRDFMSPLAFAVSASYRKNLNHNLEAELLNLGASVTLPGFFRQNYFSVKGNYVLQAQNQNEYVIYLYTTTSTDVRGYESMRVQKMKKLSFDYSFPLGYPDMGIPSVVWIKRFRATLFGDVADAELFKSRYKYASAGFNFLVDFNILRLTNNITTGISIAKGLRKNGLNYLQYGFVLSYEI